MASLTQSEHHKKVKKCTRWFNLSNAVEVKIFINLLVRSNHYIFTWLGGGRGWENATADWPNWAITGNRATTDTDCPLVQKWAAWNWNDKGVIAPRLHLSLHSEICTLLVFGKKVEIESPRKLRFGVNLAFQIAFSAALGDLYSRNKKYVPFCSCDDPCPAA